MGSKTPTRSLGNWLFFVIIYISNILLTYKTEYDIGDFVGGWNPSKVKTRLQFMKELKKPGNNFHGDHITLSLISNILKVDFMILCGELNSVTRCYSNNDRFIILYINNNHYKSIGILENKKMNGLLNSRDYDFYDKNKLTKKIIKRMIDNKFKLNDIFDSINIDGLYKTEIYDYIKECRKC